MADKQKGQFIPAIRRIRADERVAEILEERQQHFDEFQAKSIRAQAPAGNASETSSTQEERKGESRMRPEKKPHHHLPANKPDCNDRGHCQQGKCEYGAGYLLFPV